MLKKVNFAHDEVLDTSDDEEPLFCDPNFEDVELEVVVAGPAFVGRRGLRIPTSVAGDLQECELVGLKSGKVQVICQGWPHETVRRSPPPPPLYIPFASRTIAGSAYLA